MDFHEQLEPLRLHLKRRLDAGEFTQTDLARRVGVKQSSISNFVNRKGNVGRSLEASLMRALNLTPHLLFAEPPPIEPLPKDPVPIVRGRTAVFTPRILRNDIVQSSRRVIDDFREFPDLASDIRRSWTRFVAIIVTEKQARFLSRHLREGAVVVIDRHDQQIVEASSAEHADPPLYAVNDNGLLGLGFLEIRPRHVILKSDNMSIRGIHIPLDSVPAAQLIIGRICAVYKRTR